MPTIKQRRARFKRDLSVRYSLTDRDIEIIRLVYSHRFLSSDHILALMKGSRQGVLRRLNLLYHSGYLDRPKVQLTRIGNHPMIYALGNQGAQIISSELDLPMAAVDWTSKNREVKGIFLEHTLMAANFLKGVST